MKRPLGRELLLWILPGIAICFVVLSVMLAAIFASETDFFHVPFASWFIFLLDGLLLSLTGLFLYLFRHLRHSRADFEQAQAQLAALKERSGEANLPVVYGHGLLPQAEFVPILQLLFRNDPNIHSIHVEPLQGGYGGSTTVLAKFQAAKDQAFLPIRYVVKLGDQREMKDEAYKFKRHVKDFLKRMPASFEQAECGAWAGIAYNFVGLELDSDLQSLHQFYAGHSGIEVLELVKKVYAYLDQAWYQRGESVAGDLYTEYALLSSKREQIIGEIGQLVEKKDDYRDNFTAPEDRLQPNCKPGFCPNLEIPWHDPVVFLRVWAKRRLVLPLYRSFVHGDLNARNLLIEILPANQKSFWFIDFSHSGNGLSGERTRAAPDHDPDRGHTLRDFCRLEADIKFLLTRLDDERDLRQAVLFEQALVAGGLTLADPALTALPVEALRDERFRKAWQIIREVRRQATVYLNPAYDLRPYYFSLLNATLPTVYYQQSQFGDEEHARWQKRYALIAAGMLCAALNDFTR